MKFIRAAALGLLLGIFALFAVQNWTGVPMVFGATLVTVKLPVLLLAAVLAGYLPMRLRYAFSRRRWVARARPAVADLPLEHPGAISQAQPTCVPPAAA